MENTAGAYIGPMVIIKSLAEILTENLRRVEGILRDLDGVGVQQLLDVEPDTTIRIAIGDLITTLRSIPNTQTIRGNNCRVKYLTICDACQHVHNDPFLVPTSDTEEDQEEQKDEDDHETQYEHRMGNDQDDDQLDDLNEGLNGLSMSKRQRL